MSACDCSHTSSFKIASISEKSSPDKEAIWIMTLGTIASISEKSTPDKKDIWIIALGTIENLDDEREHQREGRESIILS